MGLLQFGAQGTADRFSYLPIVGLLVMLVYGLDFLRGRTGRIVAAVAPALRADGLAFVGIDVVDGHLTEVNVTSPTGLRQLCDLSGERPDLQIERWLENHVGQPGSAQPPDDVVCEDFVDD